LIINNRVGKARNSMQGMDKGEGAVGDYGTPEQEIPATGSARRRIGKLHDHDDTWGFKKNDNNWKSTGTIIGMLIDCASKGGNFLLNVGPTAQGEIPGPSLQRLAEAGKWMNINHEAIYGTTASPFKSLGLREMYSKTGQALPACGKMAD